MCYKHYFLHLNVVSSLQLIQVMFLLRTKPYIYLSNSDQCMIKLIYPIFPIIAIIIIMMMIIIVKMMIMIIMIV